MQQVRKIHTRKRTITGKSIWSMILLGVILLLGTCNAAGQWIEKWSTEVYTEHAYSYAQLIADNVSGIAPTKFMETGEKDEEYFNIRYTLMTVAIFETEFKDFYLVIPTEEDLIYISEIYHNTDENDKSFSNQQAGFLERRPYGPGEKEIMMQVLADDAKGVQKRELYLGIRQIDEEPLATALVSIHAMPNEVPAVVGVDISIERIQHSVILMYLKLTLAVALVCCIAILIHYFRIKKSLIQPIVTLKHETDELMTRLDSEEIFHSEVRTGDELEVLAHSIEEMDRSLKRYIRENTAITAERERLRTELELARGIQAAMLPNIFPPFPDRNEFDIYASMDPAKEVGGDFYDFFLIDDDHIALVIADVSGKGIPAALFMMMVKIMVQNCVLAGLEPKKAMEQVNALICRNNPENMFVTVWLGVLDIRTGRLTAVNAGHEYPMLKAPGGAFELIKDRHGLAVGVMEGVSYREYELTLQPGSTLFVYTDGLPEATSAANELMGTDRALQALNEVPEAGPEELLKNVQRAVDAFVGDAPQFDDLTMLCLCYRGETGTAEETEAAPGQPAEDDGKGEEA